MDAAEAVFVADSRAVAAQLRHLPGGTVHPDALAAVNMVGTAAGFLDGLHEAMSWLVSRGVPTTLATDRTAAEQVVRLARGSLLGDLPGWEGEVAHTWHARTTALVEYRARLPGDIDTGAVLEALLHMHHNRALGIDPGGEAACRSLARRAALAWTAQQEAADR